MSRYHNVLWFWVNTDDLKIYFTFFKCYNVRVCWRGITGTYHRQKIMFEEEIAKSCQPATSKLLPTETNNNYLTLENPDS